MKYLKKYESFTQNVSKLTDVKVGDVIIYQGSKCKVLEVDEFVIKVTSLKTNKEFLINQGQLDENGIKLVEGKSYEENKKEKSKRLPNREKRKKVPSKKAPIRLPDWNTY